MSLFSLKEWWSIRQGDGLEEFDQCSMCLGNVDNSPRARVKIITGSFAGVLRVYEPSGSSYLPSDLLLEQQMLAPILQVAIGKFIPAVPNALAILHPRALKIFQVTRPRTAADDEVPFLELQLLRAHDISHTAANLCFGPFGEVQSGDSIIVQAYDGQLYIFEEGNLIQTTFLEDFLVPGPMQYVAETDSMITCSSAFEVQSYSYKSLTQASQTKSDSLTESLGPALNKRKTPTPQWKLLIGEMAVDIKLTGSDTQEGSSDIVIVGEQTLITCSQAGVLKSQRRLEFHPAAVVSYRLPSAETNLIVATHTCNFIIYGGSRVLWLAKGPTVPVAIAVAAVGKLEAAIVVLDDEGLLSICYLGTAPPSSVLGLSEGREPDWEMIQKRRRELMRIIRDKAPSTSGAARDADPGPPRYEVALHSQVLSPARNARRLDDIMHWRTESMEGRDTIFANLEVQVPQVLTASEEFGDEAVEEREDRRCDVRVYVRNTGSHDVTGVGLKVQAAWPVVAQECAHAISHLPAGRGTPHMVSLRFSYAAEAVPSSREVTVEAAFSDADGNMYSSIHSFELPLSLFARMVPPVKSNAEKLTLAISEAPAPVLELFEDLAQSSPPDSTLHANSNSVISMRFLNQEECTILISKSNNKYRLQGTSYTALLLPLSELMRRLRRHYEAATGAEISMQLEEHVPVQWLLTCIDNHFGLRLQLQRVTAELEQAAAQFRVVQKCLLSKFREARPGSVDALSAVMEETYDQLVELADKLVELETSLRAARSKLSCAVQLVQLCIRCQCPFMTDERYAEVCACLSAEVIDGDELGWEETTDAAVTHLLRGSLAQSAQDRGMVPMLSSPMTQCDTFKSNVKQVMERLLSERPGTAA